MKLDDTPDAPARMVFGCRSCDARGFAVLDKPFLEGKFQDAYYKARRDNLLVVTRTCDSPCSTCFCHWTGGGPADPTGSDVLLTAVNGGFVLEAVSREGRSLPRRDQARRPVPTKMDEAKAAAKRPPPASSPPRICPRRPAASNSVSPTWTSGRNRPRSASPAARAPTCARPASGFNISDEGNTLEGRRLRSWDNCMSPLFTREASGHNPRTAKALRMRNRVSHQVLVRSRLQRRAFRLHGLRSVHQAVPGVAGHP